MIRIISYLLDMNIYEGSLTALNAQLNRINEGDLESEVRTLKSLTDRAFWNLIFTRRQPIESPSFFLKNNNVESKIRLFNKEYIWKYLK